ncbi:MAG: DUF6261 family protein [Prevotellaceae bacterium]|jgi:hypothetical protein|nr:DUF6261 family protein [Prevotellaceae bacterium]
MKIIKFVFPELWNSEYPLVVNQLIAIVGSANPGSLHLQGSYDRLAAFGPRLAQIEVQEQADRNSALLSELDQQRDSLFSIIKSVAKAFAGSPNLRHEAEQVQALIKKHGDDIPDTNYTAETKRLYDLIADAEQQPGLMAAVEALQLRPSFEQMRAANEEFDRQFMQRNAEQAAAEKVNVRGIRNECDKAVSALWTAIEFCMAEHGEAAYTPLVSAINTLNSYYKQQLAARATRRKAAADKKVKEALNNEAPIALPKAE